MTPPAYTRGPYKPRKTPRLVAYWVHLPGPFVARLRLLKPAQQRALIMTLKP